MDYGFFQAFEKLSKDVADLKTMIAALIVAGGDAEAMKALGTAIDQKTATWKAAAVAAPTSGA